MHVKSSSHLKQFQVYGILTKIQEAATPTLNFTESSNAERNDVLRSCVKFGDNFLTILKIPSCLSIICIAYSNLLECI